MFKDRLQSHTGRVEACLKDLFKDHGDGKLAEAMRYGVLSGGKRLRAFLVLEGADLYRVPLANADRVAAAVECMHAYSLIHDDLPSMDNDDLRRGLPTVHKKWDEATAVLTGDALQAMAFEILASFRTSADANIRLRLISSMAGAVGAAGMVLGQAQDIAAETAEVPLTLAQITALQANKTGALFTWSAVAGPVLGNSDTTTMRNYAEAIGLAFQIADDILDVEGDAGKAGKRLQKDQAAGKATFVSLLGVDGARQKANELVEQACDGLEIFGGTAKNLRDLARFIIDREM